MPDCNHGAGSGHGPKQNSCVCASDVPSVVTLFQQQERRAAPSNLFLQFWKWDTSVLAISSGEPPGSPQGARVPGCPTCTQSALRGQPLTACYVMHACRAAAGGCPSWRLCQTSGQLLAHTTAPRLPHLRDRPPCSRPSQWRTAW
jgi:hypothetical protein